MFAVSQRLPGTRPSGPRHPRPRRGVALVFVMVFVIAMAALAMSSIFMASNSTLLAKSYDRERDLRFAAEAALAIGKARVNADPALLLPAPDTAYRTLLYKAQLKSADGSTLPGVRVTVYVGLTGSSSGQDGRFASIVAHAMDENAGYGVIRRLEITQESFAKFAYWTNRESNSSTTIYFGSGDELWGPVWSNDVISINSGGAHFHDLVATAQIINGKSDGIFDVPPKERQPPMQLPSTSSLAVLADRAALGGLTVRTATDPAGIRDRIEFVAVDMNGNGVVTDPDEGFYRWYQVSPFNDDALQGRWAATDNGSGNPSFIPTAASVDRCGDWHYVASGGARKFFPLSVHSTFWLRTILTDAWNARPEARVSGTTLTKYLDREQALEANGIMGNANARCFLAGDPHLVATDRVEGAPNPAGGLYTPAQIQKGGEDTTFTPVGRYGRWIAPDLAYAPVRTARAHDGAFLYPIGKMYNKASRGVIHAPGTVGISGVVNGLVTLYSRGNIIVLDDVRYATDPVLGLCKDILGLVTDNEVVIADNALNTPIATNTSSNDNYGYLSADETPHVYIHAVVMALNTSFRVQSHQRKPDRGLNCEGTPNGRGCIYLSGGVIQESRGPVGTSGGTGFLKRYSYDRCAASNPPPFFPTTGRFQDNRYLELDPAGFEPAPYFRSVTPDRP